MTKRERGRGSVYQRKGSQIWWLKYYAEGSSKAIRESSGQRDKRKAEKLLKQRLAEVTLGQFKGIQVERTKFADLEQLIRDDYRVNERRSIVAAETCLAHLRPFFERYKPRNVTPALWDRYVSKRLDEGAARASIRNERAILRRMFALGTRKELLAGIPHFQQIDVNNARENFFEEKQFRAVHKLLPENIRPIAEFAYVTGWRKQEIVDLKWADVSFQHGEVRLVSSRSKNKQSRTFPFGAHPRLKALLDEQREHTKNIEKTQGMVIPWVFHRDGSQIKCFRHAWKKACTDAGVPNYWFHDFRRSAVRNLVQAGVPEIVAMKLTGHKSRSVFERYAITDRKMLEEAVEKLVKSEGTRKKSASGGKVIKFPGEDE